MSLYKVVELQPGRNCDNGSRNMAGDCLLKV